MVKPGTKTAVSAGLASELLRSIGYEVLGASSASEAATILKKRRDIAVVFTDIAMPYGISGIELAGLVRSEYPAVKVILSSGYPLAVLRDEHGSLGEFTFIHKPYRLADLARALRA
ncbi:response regulator [Paraburkholderia sabiae]|uniref:Response regulator n=1 Tax=Paraburkholderia sabiae TaxID=273251 RepID=A0ABU9QN72_9BURK|nr:response regulator [Paraburkholderia sabiae]WJZ79968.1 response regulator [Paraburkholderia sabiae]